MKTTELSTSLDVGCEAKGRIKDESRVFGLDNLKNGATIN